MTERTTILIIDNSIEITGAFKAVLRSCVYLNQRYNFVFVVPANSNVVKLLAQHSFEFHELPMRELRKDFRSIVVYLPVLLKNAFSLREIVRSSRAAIIHCNDFYNMLPVISLAFFSESLPYFTFVRFLPDRFPRPLRNLWFKLHQRFALEILCVSKAVFVQLPPSTKTKVVYDGLPSEESQKYIECSGKKILCIGNYIEGKGQNYVIEVFARLTNKHPDWQLVMAGGDMGLEKNKVYKQNLIDTTKKLGLAHSVQFLDFVEDVGQLYGSSAFVVNFSESESFSNTCMEAQFYGRAVVATRCGGPEEIIDHGQTGFLCENKNINDMVVHVDTLMMNESLRKQMGFEGYHRVRKKFSIANSFDIMGEAYDRMLARNNAQR